MSGQVVPVIVPEVRGMYSWSVPALVRSVMPQLTAADSDRGRVTVLKFKII
jgi:tRNA A37 threonylcarbamoyladenosine dehydratase